mmetsp:Transcript_14462/g.45459  ORF Transcript_14462/g.45459 Transcript_14462/m.45459 type:complete len:418 (-) Transcript_14462:34-1287(-)
MLLDAGLVLYVGLLGLGIWRWLSGWRLCGTQLRYLNYASLLYALLLVLLLYALVLFIRTALTDGGKSGWDRMPHWLRPIMLAAPAAAAISVALSAMQTVQHVREIHADRAPLKHDRAVQIIALPAVYGVLALNSMARMFQLHSGDFKDDFKIGRMANRTVKDEEQLYISKSETCFWVGDLYEAWALFQFGKLSLELIRASLWKMQTSDRVDEREKARALMVAHSAVESIAWLGIALFLLVCILQAGWSIYLLTFTGSSTDWATYNARAAQFGAAGMVASAGAIYNVHVVESTFHKYFEGYRPLLKFITVKIIVSFAFFQKGIFKVLKAMDETFPSFMRRIIHGCPLLGDIIRFPEVQFQLFYDSLILFECILIALLHVWGWSAHEEWYLEEKEVEEAGEESRLLPSSGSPPASSSRG